MAQHSSPAAGSEGAPIEGVYSVHRVTYFNEETHYGVVHLVPADVPSVIGFAAVGTFPAEPRTGECYRIEGVWRRDPRHGLQVRASSIVRETPRSIAAIERYLAGASIKGLGPHYARALVEHFGADTFRILQEGGERLEEVPGIGPVRAAQIRASWAEHEGIHELMVNLQGVAGLTPAQAQRIYRAYGHESWAVVSHQPFRLADEVRGFGFKTCDRIARALGIPHEAPQRLRAGVVHLLKEDLAEGHLWSAAGDLVSRASALLEVAPEAIPPQIGALLDAGRLARLDLPGIEGEAYYLAEVAHTEQRTAERLSWLLATPPSSELGIPYARAREMVSRLGHPSLTDEQREAIVSVLHGARVTVLTGGPGTGKTTTVRSLLACLEEMGVTYALCATTGRASKQLAESTERPASTVHRHLGLGIGRNAIEPIRETVLIVDESSMVDLWLLDEIVARMTRRTHLVLVGDIDQLPSVGPGAVLQDIIAAAELEHLPGIHVARLRHIFRQEAGAASMIVVNCHRVRAGHRPLRERQEEGLAADYFEMFRETPEEARALAVELASQRLPAYLGIPPSEVQVLAPMHGGQAGIRALNAALQQALNPPAPGKAEHALVGLGRSADAGRVLRVGDKVRQTRNNYTKQVLNGDLGTITAIDNALRSLTVRYDEHSVTYTFEELDQIVQAWAMTVHAAQGSQWPAIVVVMLRNHYIMLERNILYTALSRAQRLAVLITQEQAVRIAVAEDRSTRRRSGLVPRLRASLDGPPPPPQPFESQRLFD
jgi:exodeoxyribonuclease V alpha subunit